MTAAFTFPGQGSQAVGMGKALADAFPAARAVFEEVNGALSEKLTVEASASYRTFDLEADTTFITLAPAPTEVPDATSNAITYSPMELAT